MKKRFIAIALSSVLLLSGCASSSDASKQTNSILNSYLKSTEEKTTEEQTTVPLTAPKALSVTQDGATLVIDWEDVKTATGYECSYEGAKENLIKKDSFFNLKNVSEGVTYTLKVRSIRKSSKGEEYSDWTTAKYTTPTIQYEDIRYGTAMFLSSAQVEKWANTMGYKFETSTENDITTVKVHTKDEANSGFFNSAGRILSSAIAGFLGGYQEQVEDDFSDVNKIVEKYSQSGSLKDMFESEDEAATKAGKIGALQGALTAALADTDIYFVYYFSNKAKSCDMATIYLLQNTRENYESEQFGKYSKDNQGRYIISFKQGKAYFEVAQITSNGLKKWAIVGTHD